MAPPSPLSIATSSVQRLVKEEASYHRELQQQEQRIQRLEAETGPDEDGNRQYALNQEVCILVVVFLLYSNIYVCQGQWDLIYTPAFFFSPVGNMYGILLIMGNL